MSSVIGSSFTGLEAVTNCLVLAHEKEGGRRGEIGHNQRFPCSHNYITCEAYSQCLDGPVGQLHSNIRNSTLLMAN